MKQDKDLAGTQSVQRALTVLEALATSPSGIGVTELAAALGLNKSTVHRILRALLARGYAERVPGGANYRLGLRVVELSSFRLNHLELKTEAAPYLRALLGATGQPVHLATLMDTEAVYIDKVETVNSMRMYSQIGRRAALHSTSVGKALLSGLSPAELMRLVRMLPMNARTPRTITDPEELIGQVEEVRARGWAVDDMENEPGVRCVGAPIRDYRGQVIAAVSTSGPADQLAPARDAETARHVMEAARQISRRLGWLDQP